MDIQRVALACFPSYLTDSLQEGLALHVAGGTANLRDDHVGPGFFSYGVNKPLDLVGDVRDGLHGLAQIFPPAFLGNHVGIDPPGSQVGKLVQVLVNETLIMSQVQVGLRPILGDKHLSMLVGTHGPRVHIDIGVQLLGGHFQPPSLQQSAQGCSGNALTQSGHDTAGHKYILHIIASRAFIVACGEFYIQNGPSLRSGEPMWDILRQNRRYRSPSPGLPTPWYVPN